MMLTVVLLVLAVAHSTLARSSGAPSAACLNLMPQHGAASQPLPGPFSIYSNVGMKIEPSTTYTVSVSTNDGSVFNGLFCQLREDQFEASGRPYGVFSTTPGLQTRDCSGTFPGLNPASAITHSAPLNSNNVTFYWTSPANVSTVPFRIRFVCSAVVNFATVYVRLAGEVFYGRSPPGGVTFASTAPAATTPTAPPVTSDGSVCPAAAMATTDADRYRAYLDCWATRFEEWNRSYQAWLASGGRGCSATP